MNNSAPERSPRCLLPEHLRGLLVHVDAEEVSLRNTLGLLRDIPVHAIDELQQREMRLRIDQSLQHAALLSHNRIKVMTALGRLVGVPPETISFSALLPFAHPEAIALLVPARKRLQRIIRQVSVLVNSVAWVVAESQRVHLTVFESLAGSAGSDRYDANGQRNLNPGSFRFETRS